MRREDPEVTVVGGGLVGSLLSIFLARRVAGVEVYEKLPDMRRGSAAAGRSINLVVTSRGIHALDQVGLKEGALELTVPVMGRMIHSVDGEQSFQPYGRDESECNYSISRAELNCFLMTAAEERGVRFHFERTLLEADLEGGRLKFSADGGTGHVEVGASTVIGADGGGSAVRAELMKLPGFDESVELLDFGYKELLIPATGNGDYRIEKNALHIWPRGQIMLMALPNRDGSFTVTLYLPHRGPRGFDEIDSAGKVSSLFEEQFPDAIPLLPDLAESFFANPTGSLGTVRCYPWHLEDRALLIGDAAHAIVPFFGQGMNCGFEDCTILDALLADGGAGELARVLGEFDESRKPDADAIADMALENFVEMRDRVADGRFLLRKAVEHVLEQRMPLEYRTRYSMVMYSSIPYSVAFGAGEIQEEILTELCEGLDSVESLDLDLVRKLIRQRLAPYLKDHSVELDY